MKGRFSLGTLRCPRREIADGLGLPQSSAQAWHSLTEPLLMSLFLHCKPRSIPRSARFNGWWRHMRCCSRHCCSLVDRYGRRKIFICGVLLFGVASGCCGFAASIPLLVLARGAQGVGAALLVPGSLALISASFPVGERGRAIGSWSGFTAITAAFGPVLGGWLVDHASWRWVFFINLPLAVLVVGITLWRVPESRNEGMSSKLDWPGALLATVGLGAITFS